MLDDVLTRGSVVADLIAGARSWQLTDDQLLDMIRCDWRREVLGNGLVVLLHTDPSTPLIHVGVGYRVGSKDEGAGQTGLAHLFEHLMFGGTPRLPGSYITRMQGLGAMGVNAMTGRDMTRYYQTVPAHLLDYALFAEADRMGNFLDGIDASVLERERKVVLEEKAEIEGRLFGRLVLWLSEGMLSAGHPYRHPVIGYVKDIEAFTLDDVRAWYRTYYAPSNAVLVVAGGIDPDATLAAVDRHFGGISGLPRPRRMTAQVETLRHDGAMQVFDRIGVPGIVYQGWSTPSVVASPRASVAMSLAADLLGSGRSSVLHQCLVETRALATQASSDHMSGQLAGLFTVDAALKAKADRQVGAIITDAVLGFADAPVAGERMALIRGRRLSNTVRSLSAFDRRTAMLMTGEVLHGDPDWFRHEAQLVATIDESEIRAGIRRWLGEGAFQLSIDPVPSYRANAGEPPAIPLPGDPAAATIRSPEWTEATLSNGARVRISQRPADPAFHLRITIAGGQAAEPPGMEGLAALVASAPAIGAGDDDSAALADRTARASLTFEMGASLTALNLDVNGLRGGLPSAATLLADVLVRPRFHTPAFERHMASAVANAGTNAKTPRQRSTNAYFRALLGDRHRLAAPLPISPGLAVRAGWEDVARFHSEITCPEDAMLLIAGDLDPRETIAMLDAALADWRAPTVPALPPLPRRLDPAPVRPGVMLFDTPGQASVQLMLFWRTRMLSRTERVALRCLGHILCDGLSSRANRRLREEKAWTYGVRGGTGVVAPRIGPDYGSIQASVNEAHVGDALAELETLIAEMRGGVPPRESEIEHFRRSERDRLARLNETAAHAVTTMQSMFDDGLTGLADWIAHRDTVEALDEPSLAALSHDLLPDPGALVCTVLGDLSRVRPLLVAAGYGAQIIEGDEC